MQRALFVRRKGFFEFEKLVSVSEDGNCHGSCEFVFIHLPQRVEERLGVQSDA